MKKAPVLFIFLAVLTLPFLSIAQGAEGDGGRARETADALAMVEKAFEPFPGGLLWSEVLRNEDGSPMVEVGEDGSVKVKVRIAVKQSQYREWTKDVMQKLDAVSTTYEDGATDCSLVRQGAFFGAGGMPDMGDNLPPEYAAMAAQMAQMGGGMGMEMGGVVHPLAQMEMAAHAGEPPSLSFVQSELRGPASRKTGELTLRLVRPGQDAVWKGNPGDVSLRTRIYTFDGEKADKIRRLIHDAMKLTSEVEQKNLSMQRAQERADREAETELDMRGRAVSRNPERRLARPERAAPAPGAHRDGGSLVLSVSVLSGKAVLAKKDIRPTNHQSQEGEMEYPLSVSLVSLSGMWGAANDLVISPFLVMDSAHCYQAWEDWVPVGTLSDADLEQVTDIQSSVSFR